MNFMVLNKLFGALFVGSVFAVFTLQNAIVDNEAIPQLLIGDDQVQSTVTFIQEPEHTVASETYNPKADTPIIEPPAWGWSLEQSVAPVMFVTAILGLVTECLRFVQFAIRWMS